MSKHIEILTKELQYSLYIQRYLSLMLAKLFSSSSGTVISYMSLHIVWKLIILFVTFIKMVNFQLKETIDG